MRLRKCVCGGKAFLFCGEFGQELRHVYCDKCGMETASFHSGVNAQISWNRMIKRLEKENKTKNEEENDEKS